MKHGALCATVLTAFLFQNSSLFAETTLDVLEKDLNQVQQDHQAATSEATKNIISQLQAASASPAAALALYQQAGGLLPAPTPATPRNVDETPDEEQARLAKDQLAASQLATTLQAHCELMEYAVLFASDPNQQGLHDDWVAWLKSFGPAYPQVQSTRDLRGSRAPAQADGTNSADSTDTPDSTTSTDSTSSTGGGDNGGNRRRRWQQQQQQQQDQARLEPLGDWKTITMGESLIGRYLGFTGWEGKEQADWAVSDLPKFYLTDVLDPLRKTPTADTLAAWDVYIAMKNADQIEPAQWTQIDYPSLEFDRGTDDYMIKPSMDKLETLIAIVKSVPTHPKLDAMIARLHTLLEDYRNHQAGGAQTSSVAATGDSASTPPGVTVQTSTEGDMTVITTHTNAPPADPAPPNQ